MFSEKKEAHNHTLTGEGVITGQSVTQAAISLSNNVVCNQIFVLNTLIFSVDHTIICLRTRSHSCQCVCSLHEHFIILTSRKL